MDRRKYLKTIALGGIMPFVAPSLFANDKIKNLWSYNKGVSFKSNWHNWSNIKWVGPEYWGNRLQDWIIKEGSVVCDFTGANRNLHLLPIQKPKGLLGFTTSVSIEVLNKEITNIKKTCLGIRLGAKGPFEDYRSAAVFGKGFDIGLNENGDLYIDKKTVANKHKSLPNKFQLIVDAIPKTNNYQLKITVINLENSQLHIQHTEELIDDTKLTGNFSLLAHVPGKHKKNIANQQSVKYSEWAITSEELDFKEDHFFGPVHFTSK